MAIERRSSWWQRAYERLLILYPQEFRDDYGKEMATDFRERSRVESAISLWPAVLFDVAITAPKEHADMLLQDLRYALRAMRQAPGFAAVIMLTLALGIGANTAVFSVVHAVLLRTLPYQDPGKLAVIWSPNRLLSLGLDTLPPSAGDFHDWRAQSRSFAVMAAFRARPYNLSGDGNMPVRVNAIAASGDFFRVFGIAPALGRAFTLEDDQPGKSHVAVLSDGLWRRRFGSDQKVLGRTTQLNGETYTIIGVMPPEMGFPQGAELPSFYGFAAQPDVWVPFGFSVQERDNRLSHNILVVGRLGPGVSHAQAQSEMSILQARIARDHDDGSRGWGAEVVLLQEQIRGGVRRTLLLLLGAVSLVLLIACANVANLLLARASSRRKEIAIRQALGANRVRLMRQLLTENIVLSLAGGLIGLSLAALLTRTLVAIGPSGIPHLDQVGVNGWVLAFSAVLSVMTGLLFGMVPALQMSRHTLADGLNQGGGKGSGNAGETPRRLFILTEVTLTVVLLVGACLLVRSFMRVLSVEPGFATASTLVMDVSLPPAKYRDGAQQSAFFDRALARLQNLPGAQTVGAVSSLPLSNDEEVDTFSIEGRAAIPGEPLLCDSRSAGGAYFDAMRIPLLRGRLLPQSDQTGTAPAAVINQTLASRVFPGQDPIGHRIKFGDAASKTAWLTIIGVVGDVRNTSLEQQSLPQVYRPYHQSPEPYMTLVVRTSIKPETLAGAARREIAALDAEQAVANIRTMDEVVSTAVTSRRFSTFLLAMFAALALLLTSVGLYGVISYTVEKRRGEMGLRMALGATRGRLLRMIVGQGLRTTVAGLALGLGAAAALKTLLESMLYGVGPLDPWTFGAVPVALLCVAALACYLPARRASRIDPAEALRLQ
jgi:predicted permease